MNAPRPGHTHAAMHTAPEPERRDDRTVATAFLIAPSAYHRVTFEAQEKPHIIRIGTVAMLVGPAALALAMNGAVLLVTDVLFAADTVTVTVALLATLYVTLWFGFGIVRRLLK